MSKITVDRERITPKIAREYLACNTHNRALNERRVANLAAAVQRGEWEENAETIKFDENGVLIDGQHRLAAVVASKVAIHSWVARNCSTTAQETVDLGPGRSAGDILKLRGYDDAQQLAAVARWLVAYENGGRFGSQPNSETKPTPQQIVSFVEDESDLIAFARYGRWFAAQDKSLGLGQSFVGAAAYVFTEAATLEDSIAFFNQVLNPTSSSSAPGILRKRLQRGKTSISELPRAVSAPGILRKRLQRGKTSISELPRAVRAALMIKAWNAFIRGEALKQLKFAPGGQNPDVFPIIAEAIE